MWAKARLTAWLGTWAGPGDLNAFFGLMLDNMTNLVMLSAILVGGFGMPLEFVCTHMLPGTALGVLFGDLVYSWMAVRLARRTGRRDVTAMPLGLDTPSTVGMAVAVLGPVYLDTQDAYLTWQVGMATMVCVGGLKFVLSFAGDWVRRVVPAAGLLGSLAGVGVALLGFLPLLNLFRLPVVGMVALGVVLYALVAKLPLPRGLPGAAVAVLAATAVYYGLGSGGWLGDAFHWPRLSWQFTPPMPSLGFVRGMARAVDYLPVALPFGLLTIIGGINVTESARLAGDEYKTRDILLVESVATLLAGVMGGVAQSTPYIGHPAYKAMGARAGYTVATGLFVGLGGMLGLLSFVVDLLPEAAVAPILLFVGLEILHQTFVVCPRAHYPAVGLAMLPAMANLVLIELNKFFAALRVDAASLPRGLAAELSSMTMIGNGFILTSMLWGGVGALLADQRLARAALFLWIAAGLTLFGVIHSADAGGRVYWPWRLAAGVTGPYWVAVGYSLFAVLLLLFALAKPALAGAQQKC